MPRPISPEREKEYADLLAFLDFYFKHLVKSPRAGGYDVAAEAKRIADQYGKSKGLEGLRQAVNDVIEEFHDLAPESVNLIDQTLRASGLTTFSELRRRYGASYRKILKRGSIKSETDYYMINGLVADLASGISAGDRELFQAMLDRYEAAANRPLHPTAFGGG